MNGLAGACWVPSTQESITDIYIISSWPGPSRSGEAIPKTPSCIAYKDENPAVTGDANAWGFWVTPRMKSYSWTKLLLDKSAKPTDYDDPTLSKSAGLGLLQLPSGKQAQDASADFLSEIYRYIVEELEQRFSSEMLLLTPIEWIFTTPAIWSDTAKIATLGAAQKAGFGSRTSDSIRLMPEPEAAAIATISMCHKEGVYGDLKVCSNCGGMTNADNDPSLGMVF